MHSDIEEQSLTRNETLYLDIVYQLGSSLGNIWSTVQVVNEKNNTKLKHILVGKRMEAFACTHFKHRTGHILFLVFDHNPTVQSL